MPTRTARELFGAFKACAKAKDGAGFGDLFAEDATMEFPFVPGGAPLRFQGREQIRARAATRWSASPLTVESFHPLGLIEPSPDVVIAEYEVRGKVTATGEPFAVGAVIILEAQKGLIVSMREYLDPVALGKASSSPGGVRAPREVLRAPREVLRAFHAAMLAKSADALADLYATDGVHELSFPTPHQPPRILGREAIREAYARAWSDHPLDLARIDDVFVHEVDDHEHVVGQWRARATVRATGREVEITGLLVLRVQNGLIVHTRDFIDALGIARALGREPFARAADVARAADAARAGAARDQLRE
jgi:ketosteroid isomerase-like protein